MRPGLHRVVERVFDGEVGVPVRAQARIGCRLPPPLRSAAPPRGRRGAGRPRRARIAHRSSPGPRAPSPGPPRRRSPRRRRPGSATASRPARCRATSPTATPAAPATARTPPRPGPPPAPRARCAARPGPPPPCRRARGSGTRSHRRPPPRSTASRRPRPGARAPARRSPPPAPRSRARSGTPRPAPPERKRPAEDRAVEIERGTQVPRHQTHPARRPESHLAGGDGPLRGDAGFARWCRHGTLTHAQECQLFGT